MSHDLSMFWLQLRDAVPETAGEHDLATIRRQLLQARRCLEVEDRTRTSPWEDAAGNHQYRRLTKLLRACKALDRRDYEAVRAALS